MSATTETVSQSLPPYLAAAYKEAAERGLKLSREPYEAYNQRLVAPIHPLTQRSLDLSRQVGSYRPYLRQAEHMAHRGTEHFHNGYQQYMNPHQQGLLNNISAQGQRVFKEKVMPELDARFIKLGQYGSTKHAKMSRNAARDIQKEILAQQEDELAKGYQQAIQGFNMDRSRALQASGLMNQLGVAQQATRLEDIQAMREAGMITQRQEQAMIDQAYEQWKERKRHPYEQLAQYFSILQGTPKVPSSYAKRETMRPSDIYHGSDWRNIAENIGLNALGGYGRDLLGSLFARGGSVKNKIPPYMIGG